MEFCEISRQGFISLLTAHPVRFSFAVAAWSQFCRASIARAESVFQRHFFACEISVERCDERPSLQPQL
jgi:hypothetical protein